jgi:hypothetical protein
MRVEKRVQLPDLSALMSENGGEMVEFGSGWAELCRMWRMVMAMAVRDGASSVHYHPWRADGRLSYIVSGIRYELVPPPPAFAPRLIAGAGALICGSWLGAASRRWFGRPLRAEGRVRLVSGLAASDWAGVVWSIGSHAGVEWYRLDLAGGRE